MVPPAALDNLSHAELKNLVVTLFEKVAEEHEVEADDPRGADHQGRCPRRLALQRL